MEYLNFEATFRFVRTAFSLCRQALLEESTGTCEGINDYGELRLELSAVRGELADLSTAFRGAARGESVEPEETTGSDHGEQAKIRQASAFQEETVVDLAAFREETCRDLGELRRDVVDVREDLAEMRGDFDDSRVASGVFSDAEAAFREETNELRMYLGELRGAFGAVTDTSADFREETRGDLGEIRMALRAVTDISADFREETIGELGELRGAFGAVTDTSADFREETRGDLGEIRMALRAVTDISADFREETLGELGELRGALRALSMYRREEPGGDAEPVADEVTMFKVVMTCFGEKKINVIKAVRSITLLGLKDAKNLVESAGPECVIQIGIGIDEAEKYAKELREAGADVSIIGHTST